MTRTDTTSRRCFWPLLLALALVILPACGDDDEDDIDPNALTGTYTFETFVFDPVAPILPDANVLDTLVADATLLSFFPDEDFLLRYQYEGDDVVDVVAGDFNTGSNSVRLVIGEESARQRLLLPEELSLNVLDDGARLEAEIAREGVDLASYSETYANLDPSGGTLTLRLVRTSTTPR